jgi:hypothetical protein
MNDDEKEKDLPPIFFTKETKSYLKIFEVFSHIIVSSL